MTSALRLLLYMILSAAALAWAGHTWSWWPFETPWHPWVPYAFFTAFLALAFGPDGHPLPPPERAP